MPSLTPLDLDVFSPPGPSSASFSFNHAMSTLWHLPAPLLILTRQKCAVPPRSTLHPLYHAMTCPPSPSTIVFFKRAPRSPLCSNARYSVTSDFHPIQQRCRSIKDQFMCGDLEPLLSVYIYSNVVCKRKLPDGWTCQKTFATEANSQHCRLVHTRQVSIRYLGNEMIYWWYELSHPNVGDGRIIDRSADGYFRCPTGDLQCKDLQQLWRHADRHHPTIPPHASPSITPAGPTTRDVSPANFGDEKFITYPQQPETVSRAQAHVKCR